MSVVRFVSLIAIQTLFVVIIPTVIVFWATRDNSIIPLAALMFSILNYWVSRWTIKRWFRSP